MEIGLNPTLLYCSYLSLPTTGERGLTGEISIPTRRLKAVRILRAFQVYYLTLACFLVAYGELFPNQQFGLGRKIFNILVIPLIVGIVLLFLEKTWGPALSPHAKVSDNRLWKPRLTWRECLLGIFILSIGAGLFYSPYPQVVKKGTVQVATAALLYFLLLNAVRSKRDFCLFAGAFVAGGVLTAIVGMVNYSHYGNTGTITWGNPNTFGDFLLMPIALCASLTVIFFRRWRVLLIIMPLMALLLCVLFLSRSQGAWLGCVVVLIMTCALGLRHGIVAATLVFGICLLVFLPYSSKWLLLQDQSMTQRKEEVWPFAMKLIRRRPLTGYGLNTYRELYESEHNIKRPRLSHIDSPQERAQAQRTYVWKIRGNVHPHNEFFQAWISMGIPGVLFYTALFVVTLLTYLRIRRFKPDKFSLAIGLGVFIWYMGHTASGIFHCFFFSERTFSVAAIMYALMFGTLYLIPDKEVSK